jgi:hypothetical protein
MDHRPERRRPGRPNRITPAPPTVPPIAMDPLPAAAWTPLLVGRQLVTTDARAVLDRASERRQLLGRVHMHVASATPATRPRLDVHQRQLIVVDATTCHEPTCVARRPSPAGAPWVACDPKAPRLLPGCDRDREDGSQIGRFSCGALRSPAQAFSLHRTRSRTPSPFSYRVEAAGIEPASAVAPNRASTSVVRAWSRPAAGSRTTNRRASHPLEVTRQAIGAPFASSPIVGAELRISGPIRVDVALPSFD